MQQKFWMLNEEQKKPWKLKSVDLWKMATEWVKIP